MLLGLLNLLLMALAAELVRLVGYHGLQLFGVEELTCFDALVDEQVCGVALV
jgi:hypothetical protein